MIVLYISWFSLDISDYDRNREGLIFFSCERNSAAKIKHFGQILSAGTDKQLKS